MTWRRAVGTDTAAMVGLSQRLYESEVDPFYLTDPIVLSRNITRGIVEQFYNPAAEYLSVLYDGDHLAAYLWLVRGQRTPWSDDEVLEFKMAHIDLSLTARERVRIVNAMIDQAVVFADHNSIPVIVSSSVRADQQAFLRLHERRGFTVRGSIAYLRMK